jgi:hypothetical protein
MRTMCSGPGVIAALGSLCAVTACAVPQPRGPTVMALPKPGTSLAVFQQEDQQCRYYAGATIGHAQAGQAGTHPGGGNAALGTLPGASAGSATGAAAGSAGAGPGVGAESGPGPAGRVNNAGAGQYDPQTRYNIAYTQCMYSLGNAVQILPPPDDYGYYDYAAYGYPWYGYPWYDWGWPGFFGAGVFVFARGREFHHFHEGFHESFQRPFGEGFEGGFHGGGGFHR